MIDRIGRASTALARKCYGNVVANRLDALYRRLGPVVCREGAPAILVDGLWDNPNHFFRLRLFLEALPEDRRGEIIAVVRTRKDRTRRTLAALGAKRFIALEDTSPVLFREEAERLLAECKSHADLLSIALPQDLPAYVFFDTALKYARHPQPGLDDPVWMTALSGQLRDLAVAAAVFAEHDIGTAVLSHPWKSEYAALLWSALRRAVPAYHLTGFCEAIRMRRFDSVQDYLTPVEHMNFAQFSALPEQTRKSIAAIGASYLAGRRSGTQSDINARMAYLPHRRIDDRRAARLALAGGDDRPVILVSSHVWFDFPHTFGMCHFTDFKDWMVCTIDVAQRSPQYRWLLKPHPTERWYGGFRLQELATNLPDHIRLLEIETDAQTALHASDAVVTIHGTIALEAAALGLPVIAGDRSYFSSWGFVEEATSRGDYEWRLTTIGERGPTEEALRERACACAALAIAQPPPSIGALKMSCDSNGWRLAREIGERLQENTPEVDRERADIAAFLQQHEFASLAASRLVRHVGATMDADLGAK